MSFVRYIYDFIVYAPDLAFLLFVICLLISTFVQIVLLFMFG